MVKNEKSHAEGARQNRSGEGSFIAGGCDLDGEFSFSGPLTIAGRMKGRIKAEGLVIIEAQGEMDGVLEAAVIIVHGKLSGQVTALESLEIWSGSTVEGRVRARSVRVDDGSFLTADLVISSQITSAHINTPPQTTAPVTDIPASDVAPSPLGDRPASPLPGSNLARKLAAMNENQ